jgi:hypothetical protein
MRTFFVDRIWDIWHGLPTLHRQEVAEQLGDLFQTAFLSSDTRSYESIPNETMQAWLYVMGGETPGQVELSDDIHPLVLSDPQVAQVMQVYYETRRQRFGDRIFELQDQYFQLDEGSARRQFRQEHPILVQYWDWRRDFMIRNPQVAPLISDSFEPTYPDVESIPTGAQFSPQEWRSIMGQALYGLAVDAAMGESLSPLTRERLEELAEQYGTTVEGILSQLQ